MCFKRKATFAAKNTVFIYLLGRNINFDEIARETTFSVSYTRCVKEKTGDPAPRMSREILFGYKLKKNFFFLETLKWTMGGVGNIEILNGPLPHFPAKRRQICPGKGGGVWTFANCNISRIIWSEESEYNVLNSRDEDGNRGNVAFWQKIDIKCFYCFHHQGDRQIWNLIMNPPPPQFFVADQYFGEIRGKFDPVYFYVCSYNFTIRITMFFTDLSSCRILIRIWHFISKRQRVRFKFPKIEMTFDKELGEDLWMV